MSRAPHQTLAHLVRDELRGLPGCRGDCQQGRRACAAPKACRTFVAEHESALYTSLHRVTPVQPEPEENGLLAFLDGWLCATQPWLLGGIAVCLVAMAIIAAHVIAWLIELTELAARMGAQ